MKKIMTMGLVLGLFVSLITACSSSETSGSPSSSEKDTKEVTFLSNFPSETLDPHLNYTPVRAGVAETLVKINEDMELEPWLAEEWGSEDDGKTWTFTIRDDVTFHNGKQVDAAMVKQSLERNIEVSEAMKAALKVESIEAEGQRLTLILEEALPELPSELVHPNTAIVDSEEEAIGQQPVGTGPFKVVSFSPGSKVELERNEDYWDGKPKLDRATFTFNEDANARTLALQSGDADIVYRPAIESVQQLKEDDTLRTDVVPGVRTQMLLYNFNSVLADQDIRKAFDLLMDRNDVIDSTLAGYATAAGGPFSNEYPFALIEEKDGGLDQAKQHLQAAGVEMKDGKALLDGEELSLTLLTYSYRPELPLMAQILQSNAKKLGISIEIQQVENIDEEMAKSEDWDLATYSLLTAPRGDASYFLNSAYKKGGSLHSAGRVNDEELTRIIENLNATVENEERQKLAMAANEVINEKVLHSFIAHPSNVVAYKDSVKNWVTSKSEFYVLTKDLDVQLK
ncbi:nickel ABC transporter substrate-binding protein [Guptibacillus algicola]|uniref:nickel ABC transporter substrate-binding protein n=1 Tax=Guptibacillus algicola TaxID=225844 RepID=UPI001CD2F21F|nr:nickel ABC transporter substrate-binding protein [Alkalihalobacillus algicola]MCA0987362.1 ABC transporter substrate-binding protein [Alkalihalobacillus algicola]